MITQLATETVIVNDRMQRGYEYQLTAPIGGDFAPDFLPFFSPQEMLELGVFEGKYCNDCISELPREWFQYAKTGDRPDPALNCFGLKSRQSLSDWRRKGWILEPDPRGWFQWYCRYYLGRRIPDIDAIQIKRWKAFARHARQVEINCEPGNPFCRPRQRQALLQWSYNPFV